MQSIVSGNPLNMVLITTRRRLIGFRPCSLLVAHGKHVALPPTIDSVVKHHDVLFEQASTISDGLKQCETLGKCFPVGPRHVCLTLHQIVPPSEYKKRFKTVEISANVEHLFVVPAYNAADADDKSKDFVILEVDEPKHIKPFKKWLYPEAPDANRAIYCPVKVPAPGFVGTYLVEPLIAAWNDQGVDVPYKNREIESFFDGLGEPGTFATLKGEIALLKKGLMGFRIPTWSSQSGGFITHQRTDATMFCGIVCCSGTSDATSNFNAAVAADNSHFLRQYKETVLPTLPWKHVPMETKKVVGN